MASRFLSPSALFLGAATLAPVNAGAQAPHHPSVLLRQHEQASASRTAITAATVPGGYTITTIPGVSGGVLAPDPADPDVFYLRAGSYKLEQVFRLTLSGRGAATTGALELLANGTTRGDNSGNTTDGDDVLNNRFGSGGIAVLQASPLKLLLNENEYGSTTTLSGNTGETILLAEDLNGDGDFRDIVGSVPEVREYADPIGNRDTMFGGDYTGEAIAVEGGEAYSVTSVGYDFGANMGLGQVIRVEDGASTQTIYYDGLTFGAGIAFTSGGTAYVGDYRFGPHAVVELKDLNADGDAMDAGEAAELSLLEPIGGPASVAYEAGEGLLFLTANDFFSVPVAYELLAIDPATGGVVPFATGFDGSAGSVAFDSSSASFAAGSGTTGRRLLVSAGGALHVIEPTAAPAKAESWQIYQ